MSDRPIYSGNSYLAYLVSHSVATICFVASLISDIGVSHFEGDSTIDPMFKFYHLGLSAIAIFFMFFIAGLFVTAVPFALAFSIAVKFEIKSLWYFIVGGGLTGCLAACFMALVPNFGFNEPQEVWTNGAAVYDKFLDNLPVCSLAGLLAGIAAVWILKKTSS